MAEKFFVVWNENAGPPRHKHKGIHAEDNARKEAERLARENPGETFHVLKLVDSCCKKEVFWSSDFADLGEVPF